MKDLFNQAIADGLNELGYGVDIPNEKGEMKFGPECHEVCTIAEKLNKLIESWPVVYCEKKEGYQPWHNEALKLAVDVLNSIASTKISGSDVYDAAASMVFEARDALAEISKLMGEK